MAASVGMVGSCGSPSSSSWVGCGFTDGRRKRLGSSTVCLVSPCSASLTDQYRTLRIDPGASEKEVKRAFRQLALQYHPDVCKGNNCGVQFSRINEAYDIVMSNLRQSEDEAPQSQDRSSDDGYGDEEMRGMYDPTWDLWEEWMGWEGAGIRDYSSHINPYI